MQGRAAKGSDDRGHEHARLHSFARDVAHNDEHRPGHVGRKVPGRSRHPLHGQGDRRCRCEGREYPAAFGDKDLLDLLGLLNLELPLLLQLLRIEIAHEQKNGDHQQ